MLSSAFERHRRLAYVLGVILWVCLSASPARADSIDLNQGWEYRWGDSPFSAEGVPLWTQEQSDGHWSSIDFPSNPPARDGRENVWYRTTLPSGDWRDPVLYIFSVDLIVQVYLDGRKIYEHGHFDAQGKGPFAGWPWHMISLPDESAGKPLYFRIYSNYIDIGLWGEIRLMERQDLLRDILSGSVERLVTSGFSLLLALLALVFALLQREQRGFGAVALFAAASGGMILSGSQANLLLLDRPLLWDYLGASGYFLIPVAIAMLLEQWLRPESSQLPRRIWKLHLLYFCGAIGLSLTGIVSLASTYAVFDALFALTLVSMLVPVIRLLGCASADQKVILAAYALLSLLLLVDMAVAHGLLSWTHVPLPWGSLAFSLAIVFVALRHYAKTQQAVRDMNVSLEQQISARTTELETMVARETARARVLELERQKRQELETLVSALQDSRELNDSLAILTAGLPQLCLPLSGAFYQRDETGTRYRRTSRWGDHWEHAPAREIDAEEARDNTHASPGDAHWSFPITYQHPQQGERRLGLLVVRTPPSKDADQTLEDLALWRRMVKTSVEKIHLTLSLLSLQEELRRLSYEDGLTGLKNRRFLDEVLAREIALAQRRQTPLSLLICDIDHFKRFNDTHGHAAGDAVLKRVARHLQSVFRQTDIVCRYGGEEFVILMPSASAEDCRQRAEELRQRVAADRIEYTNQRLEPVTLSAGFATWPDTQRNPQALITSADQALYRAKQGGRDRVEDAAV